METKTFLFKLFINTNQGQQFNTGNKVIEAQNYNEANKLFSKLDIPFCHFVTVETIKN
jgi:hypothetical protein